MGKLWTLLVLCIQRLFSLGYQQKIIFGAGYQLDIFFCQRNKNFMIPSLHAFNLQSKIPPHPNDIWWKKKTDLVKGYFNINYPNVNHVKMIWERFFFF